MKDSHTGAYATVGLLLLLSLKFFCLYEIAQASLPILVISYLNGHISSRFFASLAMQNLDYVQSSGKSKIKSTTTQRLTIGEMCFSAIFMIAGWALFIPDWEYLIALPIAYSSKIYLCYYFKKHIGGYTGDCLGAIQQVSETTLYLAILVLV